MLDIEHSEQTTIETEELQKSRLEIKRKESGQGQGVGIGLGVWVECIVRINGIVGLQPLRNVKVRAYVEEGNNSRLIKELLRKRPQIKLVESKS